MSRELPHGIDALELELGRDVRIGARVQIGAIGGPASRVVIGDDVEIGDDVRILAPHIVIGDWTTIHHHATIYGYSPVAIGACTWIGQNATLNCTSELVLERGVTFGAYSSVYTHSSGGDPLEGFAFDSVKPALIGTDAFVAPHCLLAPVTVGPRAMVLAGSVVTADVAENTTVGGAPARVLTDKLGVPFREPDLETKFGLLLDRLRSFAQAHGAVIEEGPGWASGCGVMITLTDAPRTDLPVFDVRDRTYSKLRTPEERAFMRHLLHSVKFYPR